MQSVLCGLPGVLSQTKIVKQELGRDLSLQ